MKVGEPHDICRNTTSSANCESDVIQWRWPYLITIWRQILAILNEKGLLFQMVITM